MDPMRSGSLAAVASPTKKAMPSGNSPVSPLRSANIDYNGRFCMAAAAAAGNRAFGIDRGLPFPLAGHPGCESDPAGPGPTPPRAWPPVMQYFDAQRLAGGVLIVADPATHRHGQSR